MNIIIITTLLLSLLAPLRVEVRPRMAIAPDECQIKVYLAGDERMVTISLYDEEGFLVRSSGQELMGERLINVNWRRPPTGDLTLQVLTFDDRGKVSDSKTLDLHYLSVIGF